MLSNNIFKQAKQLLQDKPGDEMTEEELRMLNIAEIPLMILPAYSDILIDEGLEELAKILDEVKQNGAVPRRDKVRAMSPVR